MQTREVDKKEPICPYDSYVTYIVLQNEELSRSRIMWHKRHHRENDLKETFKSISRYCDMHSLESFQSDFIVLTGM